MQGINMNNNLQCLISLLFGTLFIHLELQFYT